MKNNLNQLVKDYKETAKKETLNEIYKIINPILEEKAAYAFHQKVYKRNGKLINLKEINMVTEDDILNELWVTVMEIINKYHLNKPFSNYFYATLWRWFPKDLIDQNFHFQKNIVLESSLITEDNLHPLDSLEKTDTNCETEFEELNDRENDIVKIIFCDPTIKQDELAKKMNLSQTSISNIMIEIRKKLKLF